MYDIALSLRYILPWIPEGVKGLNAAIWFTAWSVGRRTGVHARMALFSRLGAEWAANRVILWDR